MKKFSKVTGVSRLSPEERAAQYEDLLNEAFDIVVETDPRMKGHEFYDTYVDSNSFRTSGNVNAGFAISNALTRRGGNHYIPFQIPRRYFVARDSSGIADLISDAITQEIDDLNYLILLDNNKWYYTEE